MKIMVIALLILLSGAVLAQTNIKVKPKEAHRISWDGSVEPDVWKYGVFWSQGADTTLFPFVNGTDPDSLWENEPISNWNFAQVHKLYYYHEPTNTPGITYIRYGVAPVNEAGQYGLIRTYHKVIKIVKPTILPSIKVE